MTRREKAARIQAILDGLYQAPGVPLDHTDPFTLLVAVVLSAQTTDKKVNEVTPRLFARAGTPEVMADVPEDEIRALIRQIGLAPQKARSLRGLSRQIVEKHGGAVPCDWDALEALPGVGHKTASVVMSQAFGLPAFPVDTHIHRLAERWGLSDGSRVERTEADLKAVFAKERWNDAHIQIILFGREHCPALWHDLSACPICGWAASRATKAREAAANAARRKR